ncbi:MAG TPA: TlpA disulfide reductase family protein [Solirubrobacteraceae bacterium]|jgi:cytochrome c-type biogenesis protein
MSRRWRTLGAAAAALAAIALLAVFGLASNPSASSSRPAPELPREWLAGPPVTLSSLLAGTGGRPALVVFWASWCGPCAREAPAFERFAQSATGRGRLVGVDWSDGLSGARAFIRRHSWTFPNLRDGEGVVGNEYRMADLPTTFVIDARGRIRSTLRGPQDEGSLRTALAAVEHS